MLLRRFLLSMWLSLSVATAAGAQTAPPKPNFEKQVLEIIRRNPEAILESVGTYQATRERQQFIAEFEKSLKEPVKLDLKNAPALGPQNAPLTLVEFSDFQCPYCIQSQETLAALKEKYKGQLRLIYVNLPLPIHPQSRPAAQAAWAAGQQGKFFEYHDQLFALKGEIAPTSFEQLARDLKLDVERFNKDRNSSQAAAYVDGDVQMAQRLRIDGTPAFYLNGGRIQGARPIEDFEAAIKLVQKKDG